MPDFPVYDVAEDTLLLTDAAVELCAPEDTVLEVGIGGGAVSHEIIEQTGAAVIGTDINRAAVEKAQTNAIQTVQADLLTATRTAVFDVILFNAPYLPDNPQTPTRPALEGEEGGLSIITRFLEQAKQGLSADGDILLVASSKTPLSEVTEILETKDFDYETVNTTHVFFEDIVVLQCWLSG